MQDARCEVGLTVERSLLADVHTGSVDSNAIENSRTAFDSACKRSLACLAHTVGHCGSAVAFTGRGSANQSAATQSIVWLQLQLHRVVVVRELHLLRAAQWK